MKNPKRLPELYGWKNIATMRKTKNLCFEKTGVHFLNLAVDIAAGCFL